jgi:hypothetical protein
LQYRILWHRETIANKLNANQFWFHHSDTARDVLFVER